MKETINELLDMANLVDYTGVKIHIEDVTLTKELEDIPYHLLRDCLRIQSIIENFANTDISLTLVYDLWRIHSTESFCAGFSNIEGVSDGVVLKNLLGALKAICD